MIWKPVQHLFVRVSIICLDTENTRNLFLLEVIEAVDSFADSPEALDWLKRIAPISNSVADFTDRDETSRLAVDFGAALANYDRFAAFRHYVDLVNEERLYLAEDLFAKLIPYLDLSNDFEYAIARRAPIMTPEVLCENVWILLPS